MSYIVHSICLVNLKALGCSVHQVRGLRVSIDPIEKLVECIATWTSIIHMPLATWKTHAFSYLEVGVGGGATRCLHVFGTILATQ